MPRPTHPYVRTEEGCLYLAVVLDLYSRAVVGWSMSHRINRDLVLKALLMALWHRRPDGELLHHSDRRSQYASGDFQALLDERYWTPRLLKAASRGSE